MIFHHKPLLPLLLITSSFVSTAGVAPNLIKPKVIVPESIPGVETLNAQGVIKQVMSVPNQMIIDARIKDDRVQGYLENSISLPDIKTNCTTLSNAVPNKSTPIIFYCNGVKCGRSVVSIKIAKSCGYTELSWFKGGFAEWKNSGYQYTRER